MSKLSVETKLPAVGTSIFTTMSALAAEHDTINLAQGFPDFSCDPQLIKLFHKALKDGYNQYAPSSGILPLREEIAKLVEELYGATYNPETEITVCSGATEALYCAIAATINEGDEVLVFEPAYDSYVPVIQLHGGIPIYIQLEAPNYNINWENVKKQVSSRTRMIILNSPHNPTGAVLRAEDMAELTKIVETNPIVIISDEVYEHIIYDGLEHQSIARFPLLAERSFIVSSFGKTFHATGWRAGYCLAPANLMKEYRKVHQFVTFATSHPLQVAVAAYLKNRDKILELSSFYQEKRDSFQEILKASRFKALGCHGTYFQLMDYSAISDEKDMEFARRLTVESGVAAIPVSVFYHAGEDNKVLRFCFAKERETMERAAEILVKM